MGQLTYAVVGGPPVDWHGLRVFDATGAEMERVVEVDATEGWLVRMKLDEHGHPFTENDEVVTERIEGQFTIKRPGEA